MANYSIGLDFGTESCRALLINLTTGEEVAQAVYIYENGVITERLPIEGGEKLPPEWALQDPEDYLRALRKVIKEVLEQGGAESQEVIGVGIDFTACTILPVKSDGTPLCLLSKYRDNPHSWVKLWKHHAAQREADDINQVARERGEEFLKYYGGLISSEWMIPKSLQIAREAKELYDAADILIDAGDWIVLQLTAEKTRNSCVAGYKGMWIDTLGFPSKEFLGAVDPLIENIVEEKFITNIVPPGVMAGKIDEKGAELCGLPIGTPVSAATIDAHSGVPGMGVTGEGVMSLIMGTSTCHMVLSKKAILFEGFAGMVKDGIIPGFYGYESGQAATGDILAWFVKNFVPSRYAEEAQRRSIDLFQLLSEKSASLAPGASGLLALDWMNGNRSVLMNANLSGLIIGLTLATKPEEIHRALIEAVSFGTRRIVESYTSACIKIDELVGCGTLSGNPLIMQITADVCGLPIKAAASEQAVALGAAIFGAVAAGKQKGGFDTVGEAVERMVRPPIAVYKPQGERKSIYDQLYREYLKLHDHFGLHEQMMIRLRRLNQG